MANYLPGDRVWVIVEGYDWWPARVIGEEQLEAPRRDGCNTTVAFYPGTTTPESTYDLHSTRDAHIICFFETSSQKAVTSNADLQAAIQHALADDAANPLQSANVVAASASVPAATTTSAAKDKSRRKRDREEVGGGLPSSAIHNNGAHNQANSADFRSLSNSTLMELGAKIRAAVDAADLATLRTLLCRLEHVDVSQSALSHTGIGVAVGSILGSSACKSVWPLARAFISFWARHLPPETLDAIRRIQESSRSRLGVMEPTSPTRFTNTSPLRIQPISSPTFDASPSSSAVFSPTGVRTSFAQTVRMLLDSPNNNSGGAAAGADVCDRVAKELTADITDTDDRILLISRLRNPDLAFLRENLLTKRWTPRQYLEQPEEVFKTTKEKADEQQRLRLLMEATERAKTAHLRITELIACPDCGKKRAHFYEQQTRGADEPTTKFFTCLECKRTWTEE